MISFKEYLEYRTPEDSGKIFYHGSSDIVLPEKKFASPIILPPEVTTVISEKGRKKNLNMVFFTTDLKSAKIYAGRAVNRFGGKPVIYRAIPMGKIEKIHDEKGTSVYMSSWAFYEPFNLN